MMKKSDKLSSKEVAELLGVPLITVQRWVHQGKIPCKYGRKIYFFKRNEILHWAKSHQMLIQESTKTESTDEFKNPASLKNGIEKGGLFYDLEGEDIYSVLNNAIEQISFPAEIQKEKVLNELINREEIASTGIGHGVAIPHPRKPLDLNQDYPFIPVFFLKNEIDFNSVDGQPVSVLFFMFSPSTKLHLQMLSRLSYCLKDNEFLSLLQDKGSAADLIQKVAVIEKVFDAVPEQ